jgi:hypothetical protein
MVRLIKAVRSRQAPVSSHIIDYGQMIVIVEITNEGEHNQACGDAPSHDQGVVVNGRCPRRFRTRRSI